MATMHYLFLGLLSAVICTALGLGHCTLRGTRDGWQPMERVPALSQNHLLIADDGVQIGLARAGASTLTRSVKLLREQICQIALREIGVSETTGHNDGARVEAYLAYTGLGKGHAWCAAFVSWCYGQAGIAAPRNAWSPALFPMARRYTEQQIKQGQVQCADLFAIYNQRVGRIDHLGIVREINTRWVLTVEGNVNNRVLSKRRPLSTIYAFSNWVD